MGVRRSPLRDGMGECYFVRGADDMISSMDLAGWTTIHLCSESHGLGHQT